MNRLRIGIVADEKRCTLWESESAQRWTTTQAGEEEDAQERLELALGVVEEDEDEGDPASAVQSQRRGRTTRRGEVARRTAACVSAGTAGGRRACCRSRTPGG